MALEIIYDIANPYPTYTEYYKHELDQDEIKINFVKNGEAFPVVITGQNPTFTVEGTMTINNIIITDNLDIDGTNDNGLLINCRDLELMAGLMKIEFKLYKTSSLKNLYAILPLMINITPSILDSASATPESIGTVADMLQLYPDLYSIVNNGVAFEDLSTALQNEISNAIVFDTQYLSTTSVSDLSHFSSTSKVYKTNISGSLSAGMNCSGNCLIINAFSKLYFYFVNSVRTFKCSFSDPSDMEEIIHPAITALQNTVGTLNTQLENALNGGA